MRNNNNNNIFWHVIWTAWVLARHTSPSAEPIFCMYIVYFFSFCSIKEVGIQIEITPNFPWKLLVFDTYVMRYRIWHLLVNCCSVGLTEGCLFCLLLPAAKLGSLLLNASQNHCIVILDRAGQFFRHFRRFARCVEGGTCNTATAA